MISPMKAESFVKGLAKAQAEIDSGKKEKTQLKRQLTQVKKIAATPGVKKNLREGLERLEDQILKVASMEKQILDKEDLNVRDLKSEIKDLKNKLALSGPQGVSQKLDKISFLLGELTSRIDTYTNIQTEREQRVMELEKKIKAKMDEHFKELMEMEKLLLSLEKKYEHLKKTENAEADRLKIIEEKINELKVKLIEKRDEIVRNKMMQKKISADDYDEMDGKLDDFEDHLPAKYKEHLPAKPVPSPKMFMPKESPVKHKMIFPSAPPPTKPKKGFMMPPIPKQKKKGFFGWLRRLFRK